MYRILSQEFTTMSLLNQWVEVVTNQSQRLVCSFVITGNGAAQFGQEVAAKFQTFSPESPLELHQTLEELLAAVSTQNLHIEFSVLALIGEKSVLFTYNGSIFLHRQQKKGIILSSENELKVIEGKIDQSDLYLLTTQNTAPYADFIDQLFTSKIDVEIFTREVKNEFSQEKTSTAMSLVTFTQNEEKSVATEESVTTSNDESAVPPKEKKPNESLQKMLAMTQSLPNKFKNFRYLIRKELNVFFSKDVYVQQRNKKKILKVVVPTIIFIVLIMLFLLWRQQDRAAQIKAAKSVIQPIEARLSDIKKTMNDDPITARQKTEDVITDLKTAQTKLANKKIAAAAIQTELDTTNAFYQTISGLVELNVLPTFFDLSKIQSNFLATRLDIHADNLYVSDDDQKSIVAIDAQTKQPTSLPLGSLTALRDYTIMDKFLYLLGDGISRFELGNNQAATNLKPSDDQTKDATAIRSYATYLYVLNPLKRNIFRYAVDKDTLSDPVGWIHADQKIDLTTVQSMAIDGDVWLGTKTGEIHRFTSGHEADFTINGLKENFSSPISLFTQDGLDNLYVLEPAKNRLVVLNKNGNFVKEVRSTTLGTASSVAADEKLKTIYILSGSLIFETNL